jgi:heme exporter protein A
MNSAQQGLAVDKVHVFRGDRHVLRGVSLDIAPGELMQVSGPNGAGKTTLLRVVCGLLRPEQGSVAWQGVSILQSRLAYQADLAFASHEIALKGDLTALENLRFFVGLKRAVRTEELLNTLGRTGVAHCADLPVRVLSAGQRRRVAMARILGLRATFWILDEPYANLDTAGALLLSGLLKTHVDGGGMALVVAHHEINLDCRLSRLELA